MSKTELTFDNRDGLEVTIEVEYSFTPGYDDVPYLKNGDPGYPGCGPEIEIINSWEVDGYDPKTRKYSIRKEVDWDELCDSNKGLLENIEQQIIDDESAAADDRRYGEDY